MTGLLLEQAAMLPVALPLLTAALTALLWSWPRAQRAVSLMGLVLTAAAGVSLLLRVLDTGIQVIEFGGWAPPFGISFAADRLSAVLVLISGVLGVAVGLYGLVSVGDRQARAGYYVLLHGLLAAVNGAFLTGDLFNLYVWFEIMLITAMGLLALNRTRAQIDGTIRYAVLNLLSTLLFLLAVALVYGVTGSLNMADIAASLTGAETPPVMVLAAALLFAAFGIKAGYFPLFFWLPASYHTASIAVSALFAGLLTKVGVYACFRVFTLLFDVSFGGVRELAVLLAAATMVFGVFGAAVQWDVRRILSFHIVSQIGYMLLGLALATPLAMAAAVFYIVHHIIVKANLFLVAGAMQRASGTFDLRRSGGLARQSPLLALLFLIPAMSLAGIPPLSGFWAKFTIIDASFRAEAGWLAALGLFVGLMTLYSMSKIWIHAFWKPARIDRTAPRRVPVPMVAAILGLGLITVVIGLQPDPLYRFALDAAAELADRGGYIEAVLGFVPLLQEAQ